MRRERARNTMLALLQSGSEKLPRQDTEGEFKRQRAAGLQRIILNRGSQNRRRQLRRATVLHGAKLRFTAVHQSRQMTGSLHRGRG